MAVYASPKKKVAIFPFGGWGPVSDEGDILMFCPGPKRACDATFRGTDSRSTAKKKTMFPRAKSPKLCLGSSEEGALFQFSLGAISSRYAVADQSADGRRQTD